MTLLISPQAPKSSPRLHQIRSLIRAGSNLMLIAGFLLGMLLPFSGIFRPDVEKKIELAEGRKAAAFPEMHFKGSGVIRRPDTRSIKEFPRLFEKWFNDRIGFRRRLIQVFQVARYYDWTPRLLSHSPSSSHAAVGVMGHLGQSAGAASGPSQVLIGRDGWLFLQSESAIDDYRGLDLFTEEELARWKQVLTERRDWLAQRGIRYVFVIVPNKHSIYPEHLPRSITRVSDNSRLAQLAGYLEEKSDLTFINLLEPVKAGKSRQRVFHKTDTHWNAYGAFLGAQEILKPVASWFPEVHVPMHDDYEIVVTNCDIAGAKDVSPWVKMDLAVMLGSPIPFKEDVIDLVPRHESLQVPVQLEGPPRSKAERVRHRQNEQGTISNVFVLHDSCMMALAPFLAPNFREVTYHWTDDFPAEEIENAKPVLVIQELVQRRLMTHEPKNPSRVTDDLE